MQRVFKFFIFAIISLMAVPLDGFAKISPSAEKKILDILAEKFCATKKYEFDEYTGFSCKKYKDDYTDSKLSAINRQLLDAHRYTANDDFEHFSSVEYYMYGFQLKLSLVCEKNYYLFYDTICYPIPERCLGCTFNINISRTQKISDSDFQCNCGSNDAKSSVDFKKQNQEYANQMRQPWEKVEANEPIKPVSTDSAQTPPRVDLNAQAVVGSDCTNKSGHQTKAEYNSAKECIVKSCENGWKPSDDSKSCVETPEHKCKSDPLASWIAGKCKCKYGDDENNGGCLTKEAAEQQKKFRKQEKKDEKTQQSAEKVIKEIKKSVQNMEIGASMPNSAELVGNKDFQQAKTEWEKACRTYVKSDAVHGQTAYIKSSKDKLTCLIESCAKDYKRVDEKTCQKVKFADGEDCTPDDKNAAKGKYSVAKKMCEATECKDKKYKPENGKCKSSKKIDKEQEKLDKEYLAEIAKIAEAYANTLNKLVNDCKKAGKETCE